MRCLPRAPRLALGDRSQIGWVLVLGLFGGGGRGLCSLGQRALRSLGLSLCDVALGLQRIDLLQQIGPLCEPNIIAA